MRHVMPVTQAGLRAFNTKTDAPFDPAALVVVSQAGDLIAFAEAALPSSASAVPPEAAFVAPSLHTPLRAPPQPSEQTALC